MTAPARVLIATGPPAVFGGVAAKARLLAEHLIARGHPVTVAHYVPLSAGNGLNMGFPAALTGGSPQVRRYRDWDGVPFVAVGCRWPELESSYYRDSPLWRALIREHDRHIAVGGTVLPAAPFAAAAVPHLAWVATDAVTDRRDRMRAMGALRRIYESLVVRPRLVALEREVLAGPIRVLGVSRHSLQAIARVAPAPPMMARLPIPVDPGRFHPPDRPSKPGIVGCAGRFIDSRKNLALLIEAIAVLHRRGTTVRLVLAGEAPADFDRLIAAHELGDIVDFRGRLEHEQLPAFYRDLDIFALPSLQEGLAIVGIEAMASGVPVISTRSGGPEDYVRDNVTGVLVDFRAEAMADAIARVVADRDLRARLGAEARAIAVREYGPEVFARGLADAWRATWPEDRDGP